MTDRVFVTPGDEIPLTTFAEVELTLKLRASIAPTSLTGRVMGRNMLVTMRTLLKVALLTALSPTLGCAGNSPDPQPGESASRGEYAQPIYGGTVDTDHDAVVLLFDNEQGSSCSGTIVARAGNTGYVLSAASCANMDLVIQADNVACLNSDSCEQIWAVDEQTFDPAFDENDLAAGHDFSVLRFQVADETTPVIPLAGTPDGAAMGVDTTLLGYGLTATGETTLRHQVELPLSTVSDLFLQTDQTTGKGACNGDNGGPFLIAGKVAAVTSFGDGNCTEHTTGARVSSSRAWIQSQLELAGSGGTGGDGGATGEAGAAAEGGAVGEPAGGSSGSLGGGTESAAGAPSEGGAPEPDTARGGNGGQAAEATAGGAAASGDDSGCGCRWASGRRASSPLALLAFLTLLARRRRC